MHDAINLIKKGIPVAVLVTEKFVNEAVAIANRFGIQDPPLVVVSHPFGVLGSTELDEMLNQHLDSVVKTLVGRKAIERIGG